MAIKNKEGKYTCMFCNKTFTNSILADSHRDTEHDWLLLPILTEDLNRLVQFIFSKDEKVLHEDFVHMLLNYQSLQHKKLPDKEDLSDFQEM
jgi:hypothetical protein